MSLCLVYLHVHCPTILTGRVLRAATAGPSYLTAATAGPSYLTAGNLVEDHRGLRVYGLFDQMKCQEANKFIQAICSYDWGPAAGHNAGTLLVAPGNESKMSFTTQVVGPFRGQ